MIVHQVQGRHWHSSPDSWTHFAYECPICGVRGPMDVGARHVYRCRCFPESLVSHYFQGEELRDAWVAAGPYVDSPEFIGREQHCCGTRTGAAGGMAPHTCGCWKQMFALRAFESQSELDAWLAGEEVTA